MNVRVAGAATTDPAGAGEMSVVPFELVADDGAHLRGHVYLPSGDGPFATILELSQYWNNLDGPTSTPQDDGPGRAIKPNPHVERFLQEGFAFAAVSVRGTGASDGCHQWGGSREVDDAGLVVEALADQPWSNGNIGMYGLSYSGWTQYEAIASGAPSLKAVVPASGVIDLWTLLTRHGAPISGAGVTQASFDAIVTTPFFGDVKPDHLACGRYKEEVDAAIELSTDAERTKYFAERDYRDEIAGSDVAVFASNGLTDNEGHIMQFEGLWDLLQRDKRLHLFQGGHGYPLRADFLDEAVAWFDHYLRGGPDTVASGIVEYQDDQGAWHSSKSWPPKAHTEKLFLSEESLVEDIRAVVGSHRTLRSTKHPCLQVCGANPPGEPYLVECATGVAYVSPPLTEEILVAGNFTLDLQLTSDLPGGNLAAMLYHAPADHSCPIFQGPEVRRALMELQHWKEEGVPTPFPVNEMTGVKMTSHPLASRIPAGHRLILVVSGDSDEVNPSAFKPQLTIHTSTSHPSAISLPIVEGRLRFVRA